ncbi:MAG: hypothetical protein IEMM0002_1430 [bacterium]|nr:MAG: hypothetical protein IEMM0002_1430 [bacterium]
MKQIAVLLLMFAAATLSSEAVAAKKNSNVKIDAKNTTAEWAMLYDRGVETGKRLNSFCESSDFLEAEIMGGKFEVCRKFGAFYKSRQFSGSPQSFQLGFLSTLQ